MKVIAFNGSARKDGNTAILIRKVFSALEAEGIDTELFQFAGKKIRGCIACGQCFKKQDGKCVVDNDVANECIEKMVEADGIILASPTYFSDVTTEIKALIDRAGYVARANSFMLKHKIGASVVAVRRSGAIPTFDSMNHFFLIGQMIVVGSSYWNVGFGLAKGDVEQDEEGLDTMQTLGQNMAWLLKKINP